MHLIFVFCVRVKQLNKQSKVHKLSIYKKQDVESATILFSVFIFLQPFDQRIIDTLRDTVELYNKSENLSR